MRTPTPHGWPLISQSLLSKPQVDWSTILATVHVGPEGGLWKYGSLGTDWHKRSSRQNQLAPSFSSLTRLLRLWVEVNLLLHCDGPDIALFEGVIHRTRFSVSEMVIWRADQPILGAQTNSISSLRSGRTRFRRESWVWVCLILNFVRRDSSCLTTSKCHPTLSTDHSQPLRRFLMCPPGTSLEERFKDLKCLHSTTHFELNNYNSPWSAADATAAWVFWGSVSLAEASNSGTLMDDEISKPALIHTSLGLIKLISLSTLLLSQTETTQAKCAL